MNNQPKKPKWYQRLATWSNSWPGTIVIVLAITMFLAQNFIIPSGSMIKTLLVGDMLFVKKFAYGVPTPHIPWIETALVPGTDLVNNPASGHIIDGDKPQRGDIVVFRYPKNPKVHYIKRCIATAGDELFVSDKDLYLHPVEGNDYIHENYPGSNIINLQGKLWVKNPYMLKHKGIHHDSKMTPLSQTVPAQTIVYNNTQTGTRDFIRIQDEDLLVYFGEDLEKIQQKYPNEEMISFYDKMWVKNPKDYPLTKELIKEKIQTVKLGNGLDYVPYDYFMNEEIFDFASPATPFEVSEDNYFMMGDNRDHSNDSRSWGSVPYGLVEGTPWFVYFSIADDYSIRWNRVGKSINDLEGLIK